MHGIYFTLCKQFAVLIFVSVSINGDANITVNNVTTKVKGQSGKIFVYRGTNETGGVTVEFISIIEKTADNTTTAERSFNSFATLNFTFYDTSDGLYPESNITVTSFSFQANITFGNSVPTATMKTRVYIFKGAANISIDNETRTVKSGDVKFDLSIENWPFCGMQQTACSNETERYLDFAMEINPPSIGTVRNTYSLGNGASVIVPNQVVYDNTKPPRNMTSGYPTVTKKDSKTVFVIRFENFSSSALYGPVISLGADEIIESTTTQTGNINIESYGISVNVKSKSGTLEIKYAGATGDMPQNKITVAFTQLQEMTANSSNIEQHAFNSFANQDFHLSGISSTTYPNTTLATQMTTFTSVLFNGAIFHFDLYIFKKSGDIKNDNETVTVKTGNVKLNIQITNWPFCDVSSCGTFAIGKYLDFDIEIKGSNAATRLEEKMDRGSTFDLGSGSVVLSKMVQVDGNTIDMVTDYPKLIVQGNNEIYRLRFPRFNNSIVYDPLLEVYPNNGSTGIQISVQAMLAILLYLLIKDCFSRSQ